MTCAEAPKWSNKPAQGNALIVLRIFAQNGKLVSGREADRQYFEPVVDFGDERLKCRFRPILDRLADKPALSIPAACNGQAGVAAAYRFLDNERVTATRVLQPHMGARRERVVARSA